MLAPISLTILDNQASSRTLWATLRIIRLPRVRRPPIRLRNTTLAAGGYAFQNRIRVSEQNTDAGVTPHHPRAPPGPPGPRATARWPIPPVVPIDLGLDSRAL